MAGRRLGREEVHGYLLWSLDWRHAEAAEEEDRRPWLRMPTRATRVGAMGIAAWGDCEVEITTDGGLGRSERARQCKKTSAPLTRDGSELQRGGVGGVRC